MKHPCFPFYLQLDNSTGGAVERKGSVAGITAAPTAVEARIDRAIGRDGAVVAGVGNRHLVAALRKDAIPALGYLLAAREGELQCPAIDCAAASVGDCDVGREAAGPLVHCIAHPARAVARWRGRERRGGRYSRCWGRSRCLGGYWRGRGTAAWQDLNATDLGIIFDAAKLDADLSIGICRCRRFFHDRLVGPTGAGVDVEVAQDLLPIDRDVEEPLAAAGQVLPPL